MFKKRPKVSVVLASYNHADFVHEAISSVLSQTIRDLELIVVDDGSSDKTVDVIKNIQDERLTLIALKDNRAVNPRNIGIRAARGEFIAFQNSDDVWEPNKLELQLKEFAKNPAQSVCFTKVKIISTSGRELKHSWAADQFSATNKPRIDWLRYFFDKGNCHCISSAMVRRKSIDKVGVFDESLFQLSDLDLWIRCAAVGDLYIVEKPLMQMRVRGRKNISFPNDPTVRRSSIEFAQILDRYSGALLSKSLAPAFADQTSDASAHHTITLVYIIKYAWTLGAPHRMFADRLFAKLISKSEDRQVISDHFGAKIIHEFIEKRGQLEVVIK